MEVALNLTNRTRNIVFVIHYNQKNGCIITQFSIFKEEKFLYPPETKFVVTKEIKDMYCSTREEASLRCVEKANGIYHIHFRFIEIKEKDYVPSYEEETNPFSSIRNETGFPSRLLSVIWFLDSSLFK